MKSCDDCCFAKLLKVIDILQCNANGDPCIDESCTRPFLGGSPNIVCFNTRPVTFYTCSGGLFTASYTVNGITKTSSVFRVEKVDNNCCTCRVLEENPDTTSLNPYVATNSFFTVDLSCVCAIRCLSDTFVECV